MLRSRFVGSIAALLAALSGCGSSPPAAAPAAPAPVVASDPVATAPAPPTCRFFHRYQGKDGPVYLLGTVHMSVSAKDDLPPLIWDTFVTAKKVVLELDPTSVSVLSMMAKAMDPDQQPLDQQLGPERWAKLTTLVPLPPAALEKMKPAFVQMMLSLNGVDPTKSMELEFVAHAKQTGVEIGALETVEEQLAALEASMDIEGLKKAIDEHDQNAEVLAALITAYREGDLPAFMAIFEPENEADRVGDALLADRNEKWVPQIEAILANGGDVFIAVGAGHLYGEKGVVPLLEARGVRGECMLPAAQP